MLFWRLKSYCRKQLRCWEAKIELDAQMPRCEDAKSVSDVEAISHHSERLAKNRKKFLMRFFGHKIIIALRMTVSLSFVGCNFLHQKKFTQPTVDYQI